MLKRWLEFYKSGKKVAECPVSMFDRWSEDEIARWFELQVLLERTWKGVERP